MAEADAPVSVIRETSRNRLKLNRRMHREVESDAQRSVESKSLSSDQIADIANRLKSKSKVTTAELHLLKNALIDDAKHLNVVLGTQGALRGLVREISDVRRQCAAAGCICNLALGDSKSCWTVAKATGSYLVAALDSLTVELAVTCAWAVGNVAGGGARVCQLLVSQGAGGKLAGTLRAGGERRAAALYAALRLAYQLGDELSVELLEKILEGLFKYKQQCSASSQLLFILSCHNHFENREFPEKYLQELLKSTTVSIGKHVSTCKQNRCCEIVYLFRALANFVISERICSIILNSFVDNDIFKYYPAILKSENKNLVKSLLWLLGVLYKYCDQKDVLTQIIGIS
ncbi:uncharacterized protein LOC128674704 isoform X2 [Plodia interpunctella]|uniref:uncharacterized protein LOC128674704 isoform X2 n=1 Tax=Plodia interpunctella TaxID=58824 RepID=UPI002368D45C|nr:uncharacterized protein LOC128674704 isoform X2 [Plodia interpunctella]